MPSIILLAMHGTPPNDFPKNELAEFFELRGKLKRAGEAPSALIDRHNALDAKIRQWPRTDRNDPFQAGSRELAAHLNQKSGSKVIIGYNEFCAPDMDEALDDAVAAAGPAGRIVVVTPMMTRGGEHAKTDIPAAIRRARQRHPNADIIYAWPFEFPEVAGFLAAQIKPFL